MQKTGTIYGIYRADGRICYVGKTIKTLRRRSYEHLNDLRGRKHRNPVLQNIFNKEGGWLVIGRLGVVDASHLDQEEVRWIDHFKGLRYRLANIREGGGGGHVLCDESRSRSRTNAKRHWGRPEYRQRWTEAMERRWGRRVRLAGDPDQLIRLTVDDMNSLYKARRERVEMIERHARETMTWPTYKGRCFVRTKRPEYVSIPAESLPVFLAYPWHLKKGSSGRLYLARQVDGGRTKVSFKSQAGITERLTFPALPLTPHPSPHRNPVCHNDRFFRGGAGQLAGRRRPEGERVLILT